MFVTIRDKRDTEIDYQLKYAILSIAFSIVYNETQNLQKKTELINFMFHV